LHGLYKPYPGKFKDYIAIPKANGYQSLHTTVFGPYGTPLEVQIRTQQMHRIAEAGVAAHWLYKKDGQLDLAQAQQETHRWLQSLLEIQSESGDSAEFLEHIKGDLFPEDIYVFTPKGKIMALPYGATVVDFAYAVHTDVGHHCVAAKINGELSPLRAPLKSGDTVEILTAPGAKPNPSWLNFVATGKARSRIRHFLKTLQQRESAALGEKMLQQALLALKIEPETVSAAQWQCLLSEYGAKSQQEVFADIGQGKRLSFVVAQALANPSTGPSVKESFAKAARITLRGVEGVAIQYAKCCRPIPGDAIVGVFHPGQGLVVHTAECVTLRKNRPEPEQMLDVTWAEQIEGTFVAGIRMLVANRKGTLARLATEIANADANIEHLSMERPDSDSYVNMFLEVAVTCRQHLANVLRALRRIHEVRRIHRART